MSSTISETTFPQRNWEKYALCYDSLLHLTPYMDMLYEVAKNIQGKDTSLILDASCGTGNLETVLAGSTKNNNLKVVGIDTSLEMLGRARKKCAKFPDFAFLEADLNKPLPFSGDFFSQVISLNTLYAVTSPKVTLREFYRVLEPGGEVLIVTPKSDFENGLILKNHCNSPHPDEYWMNGHASAEREEFLIREAIQDESVINDMITVASCNRSITSSKHFHFFSQEEMVRLLEEVGLVITRTSLTYANQALFITATKT